LILAKAAAGFFAGWDCCSARNGRARLLWWWFPGAAHVPIGTALGIYTLWVLLPAQSDDEYKALAQARSWATSVGSLGYVGYQPDCRNCDRVLESKTGNR